MRTPVILLVIAALATGCADLDNFIKAYNEVNGGQQQPQRQRTFADISVGESQQSVERSFGAPYLIRQTGTPCVPWNGCLYPNALFVYYSNEGYTIYVRFNYGVVASTQVEYFRRTFTAMRGDIYP